MEPRLFKAQEDIEPPYDEPARCPQVLNKTRTIDDVLYIGARAPKDHQPEILFIGASVQEEEAATEIAYTHGVRLRQKPEYLKGATGMIIDVAGRAGIDMEKQAYTCLVKWLLPRTQRNRPPKKILNWGMPILENEIEKFRPKIIVCMGKPAFDQLSDLKIKFDDATGGWFWSERYQAHIYVMQPPYMLVTKPDLYEIFRIDFQEIARKLELLKLGDQVAEEVTWEVIDDVDRLEEFLNDDGEVEVINGQQIATLITSDHDRVRKRCQACPRRRKILNHPQTVRGPTRSCARLDAYRFPSCIYRAASYSADMLKPRSSEGAYAETHGVDPAAAFFREFAESPPNCEWNTSWDRPSGSPSMEGKRSAVSRISLVFR